MGVQTRGMSDEAREALSDVAFERYHVRDLDLGEAHAFLWECGGFGDDDEEAREEYDERSAEWEHRAQENMRRRVHVGRV
jgi:hypothetical protein